MISIIAAVAGNGVIGGGNTLLWHIKEDMKRFRETTAGHPLIMGRKTFESIGRPLPGRINVVVTRNSGFRADGCLIARSLGEAVALFPPSEEIFIIGGGEIYSQAIGMADRIYLTVVHKDYEGDTYFPRMDMEQWRAVFSECHERGADFEYPFEFIDYVRVV